MKLETSSFTKRVFRALFVGSALVIVVLCNGCRAMADPDGTDLPWAERPAWEFAPSIPQSMLPQ